jgi:hypothetical protein
VLFVTLYHKNYVATSSTKVIHCYLPSEVGELLVYYLWLVVVRTTSYQQEQESEAWRGLAQGICSRPVSALVAQEEETMKHNVRKLDLSNPVFTATFIA